MLSYRSTRACAVFMASLLCLFATVEASAGPRRRSGKKAQRLEPRRTPIKPRHSEVPPDHSDRRVVLKFAEGAALRVRDGRFVSLGDDDLSGLRRVMEKYPDVEIGRLFDARPERAHAADKIRIELESLRQQADLNLYFRLLLPKDTSALSLMDDLNALSLVEIAYAEPLPAPDPSMHGTTPSFVNQQTYREAAPGGIDADFANTVPGGTGANVRVIDIERGWNRTHEDLSKLAPASALEENGTANLLPGSRQHGTAVMGEIVGDDNGRGVIGIAHAADAAITNAQTTSGYELANAINVAHAALDDGDVMLLEQQIPGPNGCDDNQVGCVAVEWNQSYYDAIVSATSDGIIVVEAAGNGAQDYNDTATYGDPFPDGRADSGAIIVGAGSSPDCANPAHGRLDFSNHGTRVDVQGYGHCVVTTGYGDLQNDADDNFWYTNTFSGTSSASPIVTGAAVILSSVAQQQGDANGLSSTEARSLLEATGTPQATGGTQLAGNIGPLPNLATALETWLPVANAGGPYETPEGTDLVLSGASSSDPQNKPLTYAWDLDNDGGYDDATGVSPTFTSVGRDALYTVGLRVTDEGGATDTDTATVEVTNVAPSVGFTTNTPKAEGSALQIDGSVTDPGWLDPLTATVNWGDGSAEETLTGTIENDRPNASLTFSKAHAFGDNGNYTVEVCGRDDDTATCFSTPVTVTNVDPAVDIDPGQDKVIDEGEFLDVLANFEDPGWIDTYTGSVNWGTGDPSTAGVATVTTEGPPKDVGTLAAKFQYGDNGLFTVKPTVNDDDSGTGSDSFDLTVNNVNPTAEIGTAGTTTINGNLTFLSHAGQPVDFKGRSTDPGSDDLFLTWDWDDGPPSPDTFNAYPVNPPLFDPFPSPKVQPRDITEPQTHTFGNACLYEITFASRDDDTGTGSDEAVVVITGNGSKRRSAGYWQHQLRRNGNTDFSNAELDCYLAIVGYVSKVFNESRDASTIEKAHDVMSMAQNKGSAAEHLDRALLTALMNLSNGALEYGSVVRGRTFSDALTAAEAVRNDPNATEAELKDQRRIIDDFS